MRRGVCGLVPRLANEVAQSKAGVFVNLGRADNWVVELGARFACEFLEGIVDIDAPSAHSICAKIPEGLAVGRMLNCALESGAGFFKSPGRRW